MFFNTCFLNCFCNMLVILILKYFDLTRFK